MRVTYLTGQAASAADLGPVVVPGGVGSYDDAPLLARIAQLEQTISEILAGAPSAVAPTLSGGSLEVYDA